MFKSLSARLNITLICVTTLILGASAAWNIWTIKDIETQRLDQDAQAILQRLQSTLPQALWDFSQEQSEKLLKGEMHHPALLGIEVLDTDGKPFASANAEHSNDPGGNIIRRETVVTYMDGEKPTPVGTVRLTLSSAPIDTILENVILTRMTEIIILDVLLSVALALALGRLVMTPLKRVLGNINHMTSERDLSLRITHNARDELGDLASAFNRFLDEIQQMVTALLQASDSLRTVSQRTSQSQDKLKEEMSRQQFAIDTLTTALHEMGITAREVAQNSNDTARLVANVKHETGVGLHQVQMSTDTTTSLTREVNRSAEAINELTQGVDSITTVLEVIRGIAEQTNLLALNAAIEAARAGEQGRGFAVVADEVRSLASRTQQSTREIADTLERLHNTSENTVVTIRSSMPMAARSIENARDAGESIQRILASVGSILERSQQIASAAEQQSSALSEIDQSVGNINNVLEHTLDVAAETQQLNQELGATVHQLQSLASRFKVA